MHKSMLDWTLKKEDTVGSFIGLLAVSRELG
jgi:hypothetical protein